LNRGTSKELTGPCQQRDALSACARHCHKKFGGRLRLVDCVNDECVCEPVQSGQTIEQTRGTRVLPTNTLSNKTHRQQILDQLKSDNPQILQSRDAPALSSDPKLPALPSKSARPISSETKETETDEAKTKATTELEDVDLQALCIITTCNFDDNSTCGWLDMSADSTKLKPMSIHKGTLGNPVTGVRAVTPNDLYVATEIDGHETAMIAVDVDQLVHQGVVLKMDVFEASFGVVLKACLDELDKCTPITENGVTQEDRNWRPRFVDVPKNTKTVFLVAENTGSTKAAVAIDNIKLYYAVSTNSKDLEVKC